ANAISHGFSPPEQVLGTGTDERSDIYSFGATLYYLLTGQIPPAAHERVAGKEIEPPSKLVSGIPSELDDMLLMTLSLNVSQRPAKVIDLKSMLEALNTAAFLEQQNTPKTIQLDSSSGLAVSGIRIGASKTASSGHASTKRIRGPAPKNRAMGRGGGGQIIAIGTGLVIVVAIGSYFLFLSVFPNARTHSLRGIPQIFAFPDAVWHGLFIAVAIGVILFFGHSVIQRYFRSQVKADTIEKTTAKLPSISSSVEIPHRSQDATSMFLGPNFERSSPLFEVALMIIQCADPSFVGRKIPLNRFPFCIGRSGDSDLRIPGDLLLSRDQVVLDCNRGVFVVRDVGSRNGTFVNGRKLPVDREHSLLFGDSIRLSSNTTIAFTCDSLREFPDLTGKLLNNRYRLTKCLHASFNNAIYVAEDLKLPRDLAVKLLSPKLADYSEYMERFNREAQVAARLHHPHICRTVDFGQENVEWLGNASTPINYLCMELMHGGSLKDRLSKDEKISLDLIAEWTRKLCGALDFAHRQGVVHSGIKPSSVVFDRENNPYITDFAISSMPSEVSNRVVIGAPAFLAPEQWEGLNPTPETDQYSFAVLLYLLITGVRPYEGQENPDVRRRNFVRGPIHAHEEALNNGRGGLPPTVSLVLSQAMAMDRMDRYPSMEEFSRIFNTAVRGENMSRSDKSKIFICYYREPSAGWANLFARELKEHHGIEAFVDTQQMDMAVPFPERLRKHIKNCDVFVCLLAHETLNSSWVNEEIRIAYENHKPMVPVFQESYRHTDDAEVVEPHIDALKHYDGVFLLDKRNIHVEHTIADLARIVKETTNKK
ncbi:MAG: protein kinase, partial [Syntrophobacteraceae bacterium]